MEQAIPRINPATKRGFHHHTKFNEVARIVKIDSEQIALAPNMAFAFGATRAEKYQSALDVLQQNPAINAVIAFCPPRTDTALVLNELYAAASGRRFRLSCDGAKTGSPDSIKARLLEYAESRKKSLEKERGIIPSANDNLSATATLWGNLIRDSSGLAAAKLVDTTLTYVPEYSNGRGAESYINTHIDGVIDSQFDIRIVEVQEGSGTILFDDNDFEIKEAQLQKVTDLITCWELSVGSSVVMRCPSERAMRDGGRPCIHAHGIGQADAAEQRFVSKCDLILN